MGKIFELIATGFYTGKIPFVPATFGSLLAIPFAIAAHGNPFVSSIVGVMLFSLAVLSSDYMCEYLKQKDPKEVVIDEVIGFYISLVWFKPKVYIIVLAFVIYRILDFLKPFPARNLESLKGGWGVVMDDVVAGIYTALIVFVANKFLPLF
ncbi:MAG: phosphatidylglycerophosphatase A [candidate division WOR-3 bacterium]